MPPTAAHDVAARHPAFYKNLNKSGARPSAAGSSREQGKHLVARNHFAAVE